MLKGNLDIVSLRQVVGWAQDDALPEVPVSLVVTANDQLIGRILANRHRADLEQAGLGSGRHSFEFQFAQALAPLKRHVLRVFREADGIDLAQSPVTLEPAQSFDLSVQAALADIIRQSGTDLDIPAKVDFLADQLDRLLQQLADSDSKRAERNNYKQLLQRWRRTPGLTSVDTALEDPRADLRALVIDDLIPRSDRDAGSIVILSHMQSLQRFGYAVVFTSSADFSAADQDTAALDAIGVTVCRAPYYGSIEEILRRQAGEFDLIYFHRVANAARYGELARHHDPKATQIFSVADLHHLRFARQATAEGRPELLAHSEYLRFLEYTRAALADAVITHSKREAEVLAKHIPSAKVQVVPWAVTPKPTRIPFLQRRGVAFIGGYGHQPNIGAARWLISKIMPLVRERNPDIECFLVGSNMPENLRRLCTDGVVAVGYVKDLAEIFDKVRLTAAPLTYGAGIKGKVIESLNAGLPCVCTPFAAEGLEFSEVLQACVAESADDLAALICKLHDDEQANENCSQAGLNFVKAAFSEKALDTAMLPALGPAATASAAALRPGRTA
jgi:glycosyltransferase involved in cell wall biosynthesis